jgi:ubiquinone/menaquinone biosynthesis C-methylase UbiE
VTEGKILDLGCGDGRIAKQVFNRQIDYGLDISKSALNSARQNNIYKKLILAPAENIPLKDNSIDLVFSNCTLEHIKNLKIVLKEISRVLKPGGILTFTVPSQFYTEYNVCTKIKYKPLTIFYGWLRNKKLNHFHLYSLNQWKNLLEKYNLTIDNYYYYHRLETLSFWDLLFWLNPIFKHLSWRPNSLEEKINQSISQAVPFKKKGGTLFIATKLK